MKRTLTLVLCLMFLLSIPASATVTDSSEKRNAFEFCELFTERIGDTFGKYGYEWEPPTLSYQDYDVMEMGTNTRFVTTAAGYVEISMDSCRIDGGSFLYMDLDADTDENTQNMLRCCVAFSALEYGRDDVQMLEFESMLNSSISSDPAIRMIELWLENIEPVMKSKKTMVAVRNGSSQVVYTGKYTYSLKYSETERPGGGMMKCYYIIVSDAQ